MVATHSSLFTAIVITLINQCMTRTSCNSDCMFFKSNKGTKGHDEFKHCSVNNTTLYNASYKNRFYIMLRNVYCRSNRCGYNENNPYEINGKCCEYMFMEIAKKYGYYFNRRKLE